MRKAAQQITLGQTSGTTSAPAPIGGLNARDSLAAMAPNDAITLDNFFPSPTSVDLRNGYVSWATGFTAAIESLMPYNNYTTSKLFAASGTAFYDATATGAVGAAVVTGLTNARWQHVNFGTTGGQFLYAVNGADTPRIYNGTSWIVPALITAAQTISTITRVGTLATLTTAAPHGLVTGNQVIIAGTTPAGFSGTYVITVTGASTFTYVMASDPGGNATVVGTYTVGISLTGVTPSTFIQINSYKNRLFFIPKDSCTFWYLPVNVVGGVAAQFDLTPLFRLGGTLMFMTTWTIDNAGGVAEYAVFVSSMGEVAMYAGSDPSSPSGWTLQGMFRLGRPISRRSFCRVGSDVLILGADGFYPLSKALLTDRSAPVDAITNKIVDLISNDIVAYPTNFGWEAVLHPAGSKLIINVPQVENQIQYQYVQNLTSGAWCRFTNWNANCFATMGDTLYYGGNAVAGAAFVARADYGYSDNGGFIYGEVKTAFNYFGTPGQQKSFRMARPIINTAGNLQIAMGIDVDFADVRPTGVPTYTSSAGSLWNTSLWNTFYWGDVTSIKKNWQGVSGMGYCGALHMLIANNKTPVQWQSVDYLYEVGGVL